MTDIVEFVAACLDKTEQRILNGPFPINEGRAVFQPGRKFTTGTLHELNCEHIGCVDGNCMCGASACTCGAHERLLADIAAKRRVIARHRPATREDLGWSVHAGACFGCGTEGEFADPRTRDINDCPELRDLAAPYADRPGFKEEWRL